MKNVSYYLSAGATNWLEAETTCIVELWCKDGMCADGMICLGGLGCNIHDLIRGELEKDKEENGEDEEEEEAPIKVVLDADDPKRKNFCGSK